MRPDASSETIIPLNKRKVILVVLGSVAFVAIGVSMWGTSDMDWLNSLFIRVIAVLSVSFFGLCGIYGCVKVFDTKPGLIIDSQGIVDNASGVSVGRILWDEITGLKVSEIMGQCCSNQSPVRKGR